MKIYFFKVSFHLRKRKWEYRKGLGKIRASAGICSFHCKRKRKSVSLDFHKLNDYFL